MFNITERAGLDQVFIRGLAGEVLVDILGGKIRVYPTLFQLDRRVVFVMDYLGEKDIGAMSHTELKGDILIGLDCILADHLAGVVMTPFFDFGGNIADFHQGGFSFFLADKGTEAGRSF